MNSSRRPARGGAAQTTKTAPTAQQGRWTKAARSPWTVLCAVAAVVLGPAAATASALEQANRAPMHHAPMHHAVRVDPSQAYLPADTTRRRFTA
ncbi:hypothetical protein ACWGH3_13635 [Streptomyces sp. NPDC054884]|uniref:hypothetical protein n=1 Tax=Streptomyces sp. ME08-AFT2 TaxID=3028683 RepID=UPI0029A142CC|nr:hypothetical protein [Streptomyces sp. ME08-AFT2]MDX3313729.1 hypothetical protein [Streptomyces sp. ME08-AFT2]